MIVIKNPPQLLNFAPEIIKCMSNLSNYTGNINIQRPELWTLQLAFHPRVLRYMLFDRQVDNSLIAGEISLDNGTDSYLKTLENAVYDNSVLLDDYGQVQLLVDTSHFVLLPPEVTDDGEADELLRAQFPELEGDTALCTLPRCGVKLAFELPDGLLGFLRRTFNMAPIAHHLMPLCEYYARFCQRSGVRRMFLNFHDERMDLVVFDRDHLQLANTFAPRNASDAAFMALHAWQSLGMDVRGDELQFSGDKAMRDPVAQELRRYISYVMPAIFPAAAMRLSHDAMRAPFNLITLALCE